MQTISTQEHISQIMRLLKRFRGAIILIVVFGIGVSLSESVGITLIIPLLEGSKSAENISLPFPFNQVSDYFADMGLKQKIQAVATLLVIVTTLKSVLIYIANRLINHLHKSSIKYYHMLCFKQLMRLKIGYFNKQKLGQIQALFATNANIVGVLISNCADMITKIVTVIFLLMMLFILSWKMTLVVIVLVGVASLALKYLNARSMIAGKATHQAVQEMNSTLLDVLTGMKIVHLFNRKDDMVEKFENHTEEYRSTLFNLYKTMDLVKPMFEFIGVFSLALIMIVGSFILEGYGGVSLKVLLLFLFIFFRIMPIANVLNVSRVSISGHWPFLTSIHEFLQEKEDLYIKSGEKIFAGLQQGIEMRGIDFSYSSNESLVLRDISFNISKGLKVGIVGPSGGGKSTITELLLRFYDPQKGGIFIDGVDLREFDIVSWRKHIGVVSQDIFLFNDTARVNISFAKPDASEEEVDNAARRAYAYDFIMELPKKYNTMLGERGIRLSGGQKQRIAIARAILANPEILIFDEATSALDTESEQIVQKALNEISKGKTVITIAHRISTILDADMIFVVANGCIIQRATHQQLLEEEGVYKKLVRLQSLEAKQV